MPANGSARTTRVATTLIETTAGLTRWTAVTTAVRRDAESSPARAGRGAFAPRAPAAPSPSATPAITPAASARSTLGEGRALTRPPAGRRPARGTAPGAAP